MHRSMPLAFIVLATALTHGASCAAQEVHTDYDHHADFKAFHTFCLTKVHASNQLVEGRLRDAISRELTDKGLQSSSGQCDLSVAAVGYVASSQEYSTFYNGLGGGWGWRGRWGWGGWGGGPAITTVENIPVGTLSLDIYKAQDKSLIWRGTSQQEISTDPQKNISKLNKAVHKLFSKFPPKA